jgi:hypothetical protein
MPRRFAATTAAMRGMAGGIMFAAKRLVAPSVKS